MLSKSVQRLHDLSHGTVDQQAAACPKNFFLNRAAAYKSNAFPERPASARIRECRILRVNMFREYLLVPRP